MSDNVIVVVEEKGGGVIVVVSSIIQQVGGGGSQEGAVIIKDLYNPVTNIPDLLNPVDIMVGYAYKAITDGTFYGEKLEKWDILIANTDNPQQLVEWTRVQGNIDTDKVAFTDLENTFTKKQTIEGQQIPLQFRYVKSGDTILSMFNSSITLAEDEAFTEIQLYRNGDFKNKLSIFETFISSTASDLGSNLLRFKELFLSSYANVLGIKSAEDDANKFFASNGAVRGITETPDTAALIDISNILGNLCNMAGANPSLIYLLGDVVAGGNAKVLINAVGEPDIAGAVKIDGSVFVANTNMYMEVCSNGVRVEFWFKTI